MIEVVPVPQLRDNYAYLVIDGSSALVVDPAEADVIEAELTRRDLTLVAILSTHHHPDHTGGNAALAARHRGLRVIGAADDAARIPALTDRARDRVDLFGGIDVLRIPCHTSGHVAYRLGGELFTGDTLFAGGCGRFFEGTAADMFHALYEVFGPLPDALRVWCGHEYTVKNLEFAADLEPWNAADRLALARAERGAGRFTVPSTLGEERRTNPFLRVHEPSLAAAVALRTPGLDVEDPVAVLAALRALKDQW